MSLVFVLADRNSPVNVWLRENPLVISAIAGILGIALLYFGITGLLRGTTKDKYGNELSGGIAMLSSVLRTVFGIAATGVAIYVAIYGAW